MSKPETPCHPDCYVGAGGSILHAPRCTKNAPKAEAPPNPVSGCASCAGQAANPKPGQTACTYCETPFKAEAPPAPKRWCRCEDLFEVEGREYGHRLGCPSKPAPPAPKYAYTHRDPCHESYPCEDCGRVRTKAEGGTVWTVCDECWDKRTAAPAPVSEPCHERCYTTAGRYSAPITYHVEECPHYIPSDEEQFCDRAPVSEPPKWMAEARDMAFEELNRAFLAMKAQNAALQADLEESNSAYRLASVLCHRKDERIAALTAELEETRKTVFRAFDESSVLTAELERLRDLILDIADGQEDGIVEARAIRAAREAGKG